MPVIGAEVAWHFRGLHGLEKELAFEQLGGKEEWEREPGLERRDGDLRWAEVRINHGRGELHYVVPAQRDTLGRTLNVQRVRLACDLRAPPRIWTLLDALSDGASRRIRIS